MAKTYIESFTLLSRNAEECFFQGIERKHYLGSYPYCIFPEKELTTIHFAPITIFYGGNGSGKSTLLNLIAEKAQITRHSAFSGSAFFAGYVEGCKLTGQPIPKDSQILTSDDVFDRLLDLRYLNNGIDVRSEELLREYLDRKWTPHQLSSMAEYEDWKRSCDAKTYSGNRFVRDRLIRNMDMFSNGQSALKYFLEHITHNAVYLLDEPEKSLSIGYQLDLARFIEESARYFGCQFIIATHAPVLLAMQDARIYDLDTVPAAPRPWTELENVRQYFDFFQAHREEFL